MKTCLFYRLVLLGIIFFQTNITFSNNNNSLLLPPDSIENFTYLGSTNDDIITGVFRYSDYLVVCGSTFSGDSIPFPPSDSTSNDGTMKVFVSIMSLNLDELYKTHFVSGSGNEKLTCAVITDDGKLILAGTTNSQDLPVGENVFQDSLNAGNDAFLATFMLPDNVSSDALILPDSTFEALLLDTLFYNETPFALDQLTYFGMEGNDQITAIDVDSLGNIYCLGNTHSVSLPVGLVENTLSFAQGNGDVFFAKFDNNLESLITSSFIGSENSDLATDISVYQDSLLYLMFNSQSFDETAFDTLQLNSMSGGNGDFYILQSDLNFTSIAKAKKIGGSSLDFANSLLISHEQVYVTGFTRSHNLPTSDSIDIPDMAILDTVQAFVVQLPLSLDSISALTYLGGTSTDIGHDLVSTGNYIYVSGITNSINFQTTGSPFSYDLFGGYDVFIAKFDTLLHLASATYLGDTEDEWMNGKIPISDESIYALEDDNDYAFYTNQNQHLVFDSSFVYLGANTWSNNFIIPFEHYDQLYNGGLDMFLYRMKEALMSGGTTGTGGGGEGGGGGCSWCNDSIAPPPVVEICEGFDTMLVVSTSLPDSIFQWLVYSADSSAWIDLVDDSTFQGSNNDTLFIYNFPIELSGVSLRCYIQNTFHYYRTTPSTIFAFTPNPIVLVANSDSLYACPNDSIEISVAGALSYVWEDGYEGNTHWYTPAEELNSFVVGSNLSCGSDTAFFTIHVFPPAPPVFASAVEDTLCQYEGTWLTVSEAWSYEWSTGETTDSIWVVPDSSVFYFVRGFDENSCFSTDSVFIEVNIFENPNFLSASNDTICLGDTITIEASGLDIVEWNGLDTEEFSIEVLPEQTTIFSALGTDINQCIAEDSIEITVFEFDSPEFLFSDIDTLCLGESVTIFIEGIDTFEWMGQSFSLDSLVIQPLETTTFSALGIDQFGCQSLDSLVIIVVEFASPGFLSVTNDSICEGDSTTIVLSGITDFEWEFEGNDSLAIVYPETSTEYTVAGIDSNLCVGIETIQVTVLSLPEVYVTTSSETCEGNTDGSIILTYDEVYNILWEGDFEGDSLLDISEGLYHFWAIDNFGCSIDEVVEIVNDSSDCFYMMFVPTIFSPNLDGNNDLLFVHASGVDQFVFRLYNQWGEEVFQTNSTLESWDGNVNGQPMQEGVYYYLITGRYSNGEEIDIHSDITLVR